MRNMNAIKTNKNNNLFPDNTPIDDWFNNIKTPSLCELGTNYVITDYGIKDDGNIYTVQFQKLIDYVAGNGGGVIVIPAGTYLTGAIFFKPGVNLYIKKDGIIKGSQDITDYPVINTRIEGESCLYYSALINVYHVDGFTMCGEGTIDGNGLHAWKCFWQRRIWNPDCTNKDEQRARLVYISHSDNVTISGLHMKDSQFWTNHIYKCTHVRFLNCTISSPRTPVKAPSTDAIDIDVCSYILIKGCYIDVNDDAVSLKGGKGLLADSNPDNGSNERIIIEDCTYNFCHGCLTCGSEAIHNRNIIMRNIHIKNGYNLLWLKMRPDTSQLYEYILIENVIGKVASFININPWTQFCTSQKLLSYARHIIMRNCSCECDTYYNVNEDNSQYIIDDINLTNNDITLTGNDSSTLHNSAE